MASTKIQASDLDPNLDLAKETTLTAVQDTLANVALEATLTAVRSDVAEVKTLVENMGSDEGDGTTIVLSAVAADTVRLALLSEDKLQNDWAFSQNGIGAVINDVFALGSNDLAACITVDEIAASSTAIAAISGNANAFATCTKNETIATGMGMNTDELILSSGYGYMKYNVGDTVTLTYGGVPTEFVVAHKEYITENKIVLMNIGPFTASAWHGSANNYSSSTLRTYLNGTILGKFSAAIQAAMVTSAVSCHNKATAVTCSDKIWAPSFAEVGLGENSYAPVEGHVFELFKDSGARNKGVTWWLRTPNTSVRHGLCVACRH